MKRFLRMGVLRSAFLLTLGLIFNSPFSTFNCSAQMKHTLTIRVKARTEITGQPEAASKVCELSPLTLGVKVTGEGAVAYRWLKKTGVTYTEVVSATDDTLRIVSASAVDAGDYVCEVTGGCNADTSAVANVVVNSAPTLSFPPDLDACSTAPQDVDLTFTGTAPFTYRITGDTEDRTAAITPATITLGPSVTTTYKLVSLVDANGCHALRVEGGELAGPVEGAFVGKPFTIRSLSGAEVKTRSRIIYSWTVGGTAVEGSGDTLRYTATTAGDYHFVRTAQFGELESSVAEMSVTVVPLLADDGGIISIGILCDGKKWMLRNVNDASRGGVCYANTPSNCITDGRLYTWNEALSVCPSGWHLPSNLEFQTLNNCFNKVAWQPQYAGVWCGGWNYGGSHNYWWTSTQADSSTTYDWHLEGYTYLINSNNNKSYMFSVRCMQN